MPQIFMEDEGGEKMTKKRRCEVSREGIRSNWANLPVDILWLITTRLCYYGRIRFRGVCKSWRESCRISSCDRLPFLMNFNPSNIMNSCEFINMSVHDQVCERYIDNPTHGIDVKQVVLSSKKGWLLLAAEAADDEPYRLVIYNPFKEETIKLPAVELAVERRLCWQLQAEMSKSPEEEGFMVFVIDAITHGREIRVAIWQRDHTTWKRYSFETLLRLPRTCIDVVYNRNRGVFYCLFASDCLGIFNPMAGEWSILEPWIEKSTGGVGKLIEAEEEPLLLILYLGVFKLDRSSSRLSRMKQNDLGNRIVFITRRAVRWPQTTVIAVPAEGELRNLANRFYLISGNSIYFYSSGIQRLMCLTNKEPASPEDNNSPEILSERVWIEPPLLPL